MASEIYCFSDSYSDSLLSDSWAFRFRGFQIRGFEIRGFQIRGFQIREFQIPWISDSVALRFVFRDLLFLRFVASEIYCF